MIEPRLYRAAFIPAVLAVVLAMFSLQPRPSPLPEGLAADVVFDGSQGVRATRAVLDVASDRRAGTPGDRAAAGFVAASLRKRGFGVRRDEFKVGDRRLENVIARRAGKSARQIVVVAARDAGGVPDAGASAADTGSLLEVARVFEGRPSNRTLVLASVDGERLGQLGSKRLPARLGDPRLVDGVIVLSDMAAPTRRAAEVQAFSTTQRRGGLGLQRSLADALREETGTAGQSPSALGQLARLAFPIGIGPQGPLIASGYDAARIAGDGEIGGDGTTGEARIDRERLESLGRAALQTLTALDAGRRPARGAESYLTIAGQVMPGSILSLLALALILPALVAAIDSLARARRRLQPLWLWLAWIGAGVLPFVLALGLTYLLGLAGLIDDAPPGPIPPGLRPLEATGAIALVLLTLVVVGGLFGAGRLLRRAEPSLARPEPENAGVTVTLVLAFAALALWAINPFAALVFAPGLHLWLLCALADPGPARPVRFALLAGGLVLPALLVLYELITLSLDPVSGLWYLLLLVTGGHVGPALALLSAVLAGCLARLVTLAWRPANPPGEQRPSVRGPATYAGPGSLGGTSSAIGRR